MRTVSCRAGPLDVFGSRAAPGDPGCLRFRAELGLKFVVGTDGWNACPTQDVGAYPGYAEFREAIADPEYENHPRMLDGSEAVRAYGVRSGPGQRSAAGGAVTMRALRFDCRLTKSGTGREVAEHLRQGRLRLS
jgi:hypothetical protein